MEKVINQEPTKIEMEIIDLRSDTVTKPSRGMLDAIMGAEVGDDVFGEDPSVNELERKTAHIFGHEAGLFCPSGTMTNQIAIQVHTVPGDEVICHENSHVYNYEGGGIARNALSSSKLIRNSSGTLNADEVRDAVNETKDWLARTSLVVAEDTVNRGGGKCYDLQDLRAISHTCKELGLAFHLDGARVFNAIVKRSHESKAYGSLFHSVSICFSKGLGTPVGSVLIGSRDFIKKARRVRKVMGGGMRQAGILAAAGLYALEHNINRLEEDHKRAEELADFLKNKAKVTEVIFPETNILIFDVDPKWGSAVILNQLEKEGLRAVAFGKNRIRMVTHLNIGDYEIEKAGKILTKVLS